MSGNPCHREHGQTVLQIDPGTSSTRTVFLHVLSAVDADQEQPPEVSWRPVDPGRIEVVVDGVSTRLEVPHWFGK